MANNPQSEEPDCFVTLAIITENKGLSVFTSWAKRVRVLSLTEEYLGLYMMISAISELHVDTATQ
jgi:hypothetical protein